MLVVEASDEGNGHLGERVQDHQRGIKAARRAGEEGAQALVLCPSRTSRKPPSLSKRVAGQKTGYPRVAIRDHGHAVHDDEAASA
jgi:hypothetical protein